MTTEATWRGPSRVHRAWCGAALAGAMLAPGFAAGNYSFDIEFTPDQLPSPGAVGPAGAPPIDPNGPSLFTALQEQLGLKLDSQRGPVEMLVIASVSQPTPD